MGNNGTAVPCYRKKRTWLTKQTPKYKTKILKNTLGRPGIAWGWKPRRRKVVKSFRRRRREIKGGRRSETYSQTSTWDKTHQRKLNIGWNIRDENISTEIYKMMAEEWDVITHTNMRYTKIWNSIFWNIYICRAVFLGTITSFNLALLQLLWGEIVLLFAIKGFLKL